MSINDNESFLILKLSRGLVARVSSEDVEFTKYKYSVVSNGHKDYAVRSEPGNNNKKIYLAREIMQRILGDTPLLKGDIVRHRDNNPLNNKRSNLYIQERRGSSSKNS